MGFPRSAGFTRQLVLPPEPGLTKPGSDARLAAIPGLTKPVTPGGIPGCIVAYNARAASSFADSLINRISPGLYNCGVQNAPTWDAVNGWIFNGTSNWLTSIAPAPTFSYFIRFDKGAYNSWYALFGSVHGGVYSVSIAPDWNNTCIYQCGTTNAVVSPARKSGVLAMANSHAYYNGVDEGVSLPSWDGSNAHALAIGGLYNGGGLVNALPCHVQAVRVYGRPLAASEVKQVTTEMAAI